MIYKINKDIDILVNDAGTLFNSLFQMTSENNYKKYSNKLFSQIFLTQKFLDQCQKIKVILFLFPQHRV